MILTTFKIWPYRTEDTRVRCLIFNNSLFVRWQWLMHLLSMSFFTLLRFESFKLSAVMLLYDNAKYTYTRGPWTATPVSNKVQETGKIKNVKNIPNWCIYEKNHSIHQTGKIFQIIFLIWTKNFVIGHFLLNGMKWKLDKNTLNHQTFNLFLEYKWEVN